MHSLLALPLAERPSSVNLPLIQMSLVPECKEALVLWLKSAPGSTWSREHYKLLQKQPGLCHSSTPCGAKKAHSGTAGGFLGDFPYEIVDCISCKICPPSHPQHCQAVTIAAQPREGNRGIRGAVSYCRELGRHGRGRALQQCPGLLQDGQHSLLPTAERGGAGTGAEPAVLTQYSRNLICLIYSLGKKKINKWHLACPHVSLSQRRCQLNEPKPSA